MILEVHEPPKDSDTARDIAKLLKSKNLKYIVATSNALRREYIKIFPRARDRILVAHNGSSLPVPSRDKGDVPELPGRNTKIKIGYIGHLYPGKGMEMIQKLADRFPDIDFHVIGGTKEDIRHWKKVINNKNIIFYGFIPPGSLSKYYKYFDIVLAPYQKKVKTFGGGIDNSRWICPLKIFDYMAHSKAIIASDIILKDVLYDRVNCLLCPPDDVGKWQKAIGELINNAELKTRIEKKAYKDFIKNYTWTKRARKVLEPLNR
ncbi:MAG: glycosyltransferase family 4 protein [Clostridiaceae bacterium]|nr:glycosyltransferase family 4 protein [Clostridiaceae bacterium]